MNKKSGLVRMVLCKITVLENGLSYPFKICLTKIFYRKPAALSMGGLCSFLKWFLCICADMKKARQKPDFLKIYFGFYIPRIIDATRK